MPQELLIQMVLELLYNEYSRYQNDVVMIRERIRLFGADADRLYELIVCETRLDTIAVLSRKLRHIIQQYR